jgi:hypothetical protein
MIGASNVVASGNAAGLLFYPSRAISGALAVQSQHNLSGLKGAQEVRNK